MNTKTTFPGRSIGQMGNTMQTRTVIPLLLIGLLVALISLGCLERTPEPFSAHIVSIENPTQSSITIRWTSNTEGDFALYRIFWNTEDIFNMEDADFLEVPGFADTLLTIDNLSQATLYHIAMEVEDHDGLISEISNIRTASTMSWLMEDFTISVGSEPYGVAFSPDGTNLMVSNSEDGTVSAIDVVESQVSQTLVDFSYPWDIAVSADSTSFFVTEGTAGNLKQILFEDFSLVQEVSTGATPTAVAMSPYGDEAFVVNSGSQTISVVNLEDGIVSNEIAIGGIAYETALDPFGEYAYFSLPAQNAIVPVSFTDHSVLDPIPVGAAPLGMAIAPDGLTLFVCNSGDNTVSAVSLDNGDGGSSVVLDVGLNPQAVDVAQTGYYAYVANYDDGTISVISLATMTIVETVDVRPTPINLAVSPDSKMAYIVHAVGGEVSMLELSK